MKIIHRNLTLVNVTFYLIVISLLYNISFSYAALTTTTANTIKGHSPRLNSMLESAIMNQTHFDLMGIEYAGVKYYDQTQLDNALSSLNPLITKPSDLTLSPVLKNLSVTDVVDEDGDSHFNVVAPSLSLAWVYHDGVNEYELNTSQMNNTFCDLADNGITPYVKIDTDLILSTQYGDPHYQYYPDSSYGINHKAVTTFETVKPNYSINYAKPNMIIWGMDVDVATVWNSTNGFVTQSINPSTYHLNFPTTGADGLYFDLILSCSDATQLRWDPVTVNGITATPSNITPTSVRITLSGPAATTVQSNALSPTMADPFTNGTQLVIKGKKSGITAVEYGFVLNKWFIARHRTTTGVTNYSAQEQWCHRLGNNSANYHITNYIDLSNSSNPDSYPNNVLRTIDGALMAEWGQLVNYGVAHFNSGVGGGGYSTSDFVASGFHLQVSDNDGSVWQWQDSLNNAVICVSN